MRFLVTETCTKQFWVEARDEEHAKDIVDHLPPQEGRAVKYEFEAVELFEEVSCEDSVHF